MLGNVSHVLLILFVSLANLETTISIHHVHPSMRVISLNVSSSFTGVGPIRMESSSDESNLVEYVSFYHHYYRDKFVTVLNENMHNILYSIMYVLCSIAISN
jgi:hypothetical protein